ncbi:MAG TPA: pyruvate dehydrogenase complex dihydrolipoamide acetyltransferase [Xanthobacteraceae bacterium]|nr:pyruvate dehydrogenase complex dihydrolipoamide acetyltransferase [Xanthobacteraceae bacterium]
MDVLMPQLGETVAEGKISTWFKAVGDAVKPGDNLFEIETDKVSMEVPSITSGVLAEIRVAAGEVAPVGAIVAVIADKAGAVAAPQRGANSQPAATGAPPKATIAAQTISTSAAATQAQPAPRATLDPFREVRTPPRNFGPARLATGTATTPLARRLASEAGIDLSRIKGSGPHGRIVAGDVRAAAGAAAPATTAPMAARRAGADQIKALYGDTPYEEVPLDNMRRTIAARLTEAVQTIPHFHLTLDVELDRLLALRAEANAAAPEGAKLSVNDFVIKALALALQRVPAANAVWAEDRILRFRQSDIGIAVALDGGLITPIIRQAEAKSLSAIAAEMRDLSARARERKLKPQEYQGGAAAISNLGMYGIREFSAVINPPHATILAVGAAQRRPAESEDGGVRFVSQMTVTLACDHRVVDGALGAELLGAFKGFVERPVTMLV